MFLSRFFKKAFLTSFFISVFYIAHSQSFDLGLKGDVGTAYFLNSNLTKSGTEQGFRFSISYNYGLHMSLNLSEGSCLELDILPGTLTQSYSGAFNSNGVLPGSGMEYYSGESYTSKIAMSITDIPFLYRYEKRRGTYFEGGITYEMISSVTYTASYSGTSSNHSFAVNENVTTQYPKGDFLLTAGIGKDMQLGKGSRFYLNYGGRLAFGLMDLQGVDGHGQDLLGASSLPLYHPNSGPAYYPEYHETRSFIVTLNAGIFYRFSSGDGRGGDMGY